MPVGAIIRDEFGGIVSDYGTSFGRILGFVDIDNDVNPAGEITDPRFAEGTPWVFITGPNFYTPVYNIVGNTVYFSRSVNAERFGASQSFLKFRLYYGTF